MKLFEAWVVLVTLIITIATGVSLWLDIEVSTARDAYEYSVVVFKDENFETSSSNLGKKGWDMVSCRRASMDVPGGSEPVYECIVKRAYRN